MILKPEDLSIKDNYKLIIGSILPRPIALVSTLSDDGVPNLAPFSFFTGLTSKPPTIGFAPALKGKEANKKDTLSNIESSGEFVVNIVTEDISEQMNKTAFEFPPDVDEFEIAGFTAIDSEIVKPPRVKESPINLECKLYQVVYIGDGTAGSGAFVIGEIVAYHIDDALYNDGRIDTALLKPVGRLAGQDYTTLGRCFSMDRK
ncbi:MAG: flavin reductase family protein [Calditrichia bacterium]|nr:flavin reductase family protein [Calditrichia bacterium]